jgi:hypothetical protein
MPAAAANTAKPLIAKNASKSRARTPRCHGNEALARPDPRVGTAAVTVDPRQHGDINMTSAKYYH